MTLLKTAIAPFTNTWLRMKCMMMNQDEINHAHLGMANGKVPPSWSPERDKAYPLRTWVQDVRLWAMATDTDVQRQGPSAALRIAGTARELIRELDVNVLAQGMMLQDAQGNLVQTSGLECLIRALQRRYAPLAQELEIFCLQEILFFRRMPGEDTDACISRFELARDKALAGANFDMSWVGFAFLLMSTLGIHRSQWPLLLAPTQGSLPNTDVQYRAFIEYIRRNGHMTDKGVDSVKNMNFYTEETQHAEAFTVMPYLHASSWEQPWASQSYQSYAMSENDTVSEPSSCNSGDSEPDLSDMHALPQNVAGEQLYLSYRHAKRRWRKFTGGFKRRLGRKFGRRKGMKGRFGKGSFGKAGLGKAGKGKSKGKHYFTEQPQQDYYYDDWTSEHAYWTDEYSAWPESEHGETVESIVYLGKGKFRRGNPKGKDGKTLECSLCGSEDHLIAKCPKNTKGLTHAQAQANAGRTFHSAQTASSSAAASSEVPSWGSEWSSKLYFMQPREKQPKLNMCSLVSFADGTEVVLEGNESGNEQCEEYHDESKSIRKFYPPAVENSRGTATLSRNNDSRSITARQFSYMWFMPSSFHAQVRIAGGGPALLIDPGAFDNLVGDEWVKEAADIAGKSGHGCAWQKLKARLAVEGVGKESNEATDEAIVPICFESGETGTFTAPVITNSKLPALLGLQSLTRKRALLDVYNQQIIFVGPGGYKLQLSPGSKMHKLTPARTGHLMLPCQCWDKAKMQPGTPGISL